MRNTSYLIEHTDRSWVKRRKQSARMATFPAPVTQHNSYKAYVNPQWVKLLDVLGMNVQYVRCAGSELFTSGGKRILDRRVRHILPRKKPALPEGPLPLGRVETTFTTALPGENHDP